MKAGGALRASLGSNLGLAESIVKGPMIGTTYSISDTYCINVHKSQSLTTPFVGTLTFSYW